MGKYEPILRIAELGNLTRAAEELGYSQSSLSYILNNIEGELGVKLFHRERLGVTPTKGGASLLELMGRIETLEKQLQFLALSLRTSVLRVGSMTSMSIAWLPSLLRTFQEKFPETTIHVLQQDSYRDLLLSLERDALDCTFFVGKHSPSLEFLPLYEDEYFVVVSRDHPLAQRTAIPQEALYQYTFVPPSEILAGSGPMNELYQSLLSTCKLFTELSDDLAVVKLVETGFGFSILTDLILRTVSAGKSLVAIPFDPPVYRTVGLLSRPHKGVSDVTRSFLQIAKTYIPRWQAGCLPQGS